MKLLANLSRETLQSIERDFPEGTDLHRIARVLGVSPEELVLYNMGTAERPGLAAHFRRLVEQDLSLDLGRRFSFSGPDGWKEYRWFITATEDLWHHYGLKLTNHLGALDRWFRGYAIESFTAYMSEIAWALKSSTREWQDGREEPDSGASSGWSAITSDPTSFIQHIQSLRDASPHSSSPRDWKHELRSLLKFGHGIEHKKDSTLERWAREGRRRQTRPGWHLSALDFYVHGDPIPTATSLSHAVRHDGFPYIEHWVFKGMDPSLASAQGYWVTIALGKGVLMPEEIDQIIARVTPHLGSLQIGENAQFQHSRGDSDVRPAIGPFATKLLARRVLRALRHKDFPVRKIREVSIPISTHDWWLEFDPLAVHPLREYRKQYRVQLMQILRRYKPDGPLDFSYIRLDAGWWVKLGPYFDETECRRDARRLYGRKVSTTRIGSPNSPSVQTFMVPASHVQWRFCHRSDDLCK